MDMKCLRESAIRKANKPKSVVPGHLPRKLVTVFCPELAGPICNISNSIMDSSKQGTAKWPTNWKLEFGTPLEKISDPQTEYNLRIISLTACTPMWIWGPRKQRW